jgi:hypothetical protein
VADKSTQMVLEALRQAAAEPAGTPLHGSKAAPGLFAATGLGRQAALRCKSEGYLQVVRSETRGKHTLEFCTLTEKGLAYLLAQVDPRHALEDFIRALETRQAQAAELLQAARQMQASLEALKTAAAQVLDRLARPDAPHRPAQRGIDGEEGAPAGAARNERAWRGPPPSANGSPGWVEALLPFLASWPAARPGGALGDCPLPELFRHAQQHEPALTVGRFHDALRRLNEEQRIYLHPWTGPLYAIPEPAYVLLVGHEIAYYASERR